MTIRPGEEWGRAIARPATLHVVGSDRELARAVAAGTQDLQLTGGDMYRTIGSPRGGSADRRRALPIDVLEVAVDARPPELAAAHVVIRSPWWRGGPLRGRYVMVMNAEFIGDWDVAPRGHPNDGRVEVVEVAADLGVRQRLAARRRLPAASHVPHPSITTRSARRTSWRSARPMAVSIDGRRAVLGRSIEVTVRPDAVVLHV